MLEGILGLANKLSLAVIAEGIEEPDQLDLLRRLGCGMGQGYLLAWPAPAPALEELLASGGLLQLGPSAEVGGVIGLPGTNPPLTRGASGIGTRGAARSGRPVPGSVG